MSEIKVGMKLLVTAETIEIFVESESMAFYGPTFSQGGRFVGTFPRDWKLWSPGEVVVVESIGADYNCCRKGEQCGHFFYIDEVRAMRKAYCEKYPDDCKKA